MQVSRLKSFDASQGQETDLFNLLLSHSHW